MRVASYAGSHRMQSFSGFIPILCAICIFSWPRHVWAVENTSGPVAALNEVLEDLLLESLPEKYEETPGWGDTRRVTSGLKFDTNDGRLSIEKRRKHVNHGLWKHYKVWFDRPGKHLKVRIKSLRRIDGGRFAFDVLIRARLSGSARHSQWERGVQIYNVSAEGTADIELRLQCEVGLRVVPEGYFLALALEPEVKGLDIDLRNFDLNRVSKLGGNFAHELGEGLKHTVERKISKREGRFLDKLNASIAKRRDRLVLSPADLGELMPGS